MLLFTLVFYNYTFSKQISSNETSLENFKIDSINDRSDRPEVFCKKDVLKNLAKFTGKYLCQSLFFTKVAGLQLY